MTSGADAATRDRAQRLQDLHRGRRPVVLPTVWDAWSARTAEQAGFDALTVGSHPLADALGEADGEVMSPDTVFAAVRRITGAVAIPVSVDLESGYGLEPADLVRGLVDAGGAGVNLEDTVHGEGGRLRTADEHAAYVGAVVEAARSLDVPVVVNGRTDFFKGVDGDLAPALEAGIARLTALQAAGADSVYPVRVLDDASISAVVAALDVPVNITAKPEAADLERLTRLGVGRISFGPFLQQAVTPLLTGLITPWR